jgi:hypothetical protein
LLAADPPWRLRSLRPARSKDRAKTAKVKPADDRFLYGSQETKMCTALARECRVLPTATLQRLR